jgi:hypothetical protein
MPPLEELLDGPFVAGRLKGELEVKSAVLANLTLDRQTTTVVVDDTVTD